MRRTLTRTVYIADRLFAEGLILEEELSRISDIGGLTQQADALIKAVLYQRCAERFVQLIGEVEPRLDGIFTHSERMHEHSQEINTEPSEGN